MSDGVAKVQDQMWSVALGVVLAGALTRVALLGHQHLFSQAIEVVEEGAEVALSGVSFRQWLVEEANGIALGVAGLQALRVAVSKTWQLSCMEPPVDPDDAGRVARMEAHWSEAGRFLRTFIPVTLVTLSLVSAVSQSVPNGSRWMTKAPASGVFADPVNKGFIWKSFPFPMHLHRLSVRNPGTFAFTLAMGISLHLWSQDGRRERSSDSERRLSGLREAVRVVGGTAAAVGFVHGIAFLYHRHWHRRFNDAFSLRNRTFELGGPVFADVGHHLLAHYPGITALGAGLGFALATALMRTWQVDLYARRAGENGDRNHD